MLHHQISLYTDFFGSFFVHVSQIIEILPCSQRKFQQNSSCLSRIQAQNSKQEGPRSPDSWISLPRKDIQLSCRNIAQQHGHSMPCPFLSPPMSVCPHPSQMYTALAKHSGISLTLTCKGDLWIDDHHTADKPVCSFHPHLAWESVHRIAPSLLVLLSSRPWAKSVASVATALALPRWTRSLSPLLCHMLQLTPSPGRLYHEQSLISVHGRTA